MLSRLNTNDQQTSLFYDSLTCNMDTRWIFQGMMLWENTEKALKLFSRCGDRYSLHIVKARHSPQTLAMNASLLPRRSWKELTSRTSKSTPTGSLKYG